MLRHRTSLWNAELMWGSEGISGSGLGIKTHTYHSRLRGNDDFLLNCFNQKRNDSGVNGGGTWRWFYTPDFHPDS